MTIGLAYFVGLIFIFIVIFFLFIRQFIFIIESQASLVIFLAATAIYSFIIATSLRIALFF